MRRIHVMKKRFKQYIIAIVILLINVLAYIQYTGNINKRLELQTETHLKTLIDETTECINIKVEERLETYKSVATFIGNMDNLETEEVVKALRNQAETAGYTEFDLVDMEGNGYKSKGGASYLKDENYKKAIEGKSIVGVKTDIFGTLKGINYYIPIYSRNEITGVLVFYSSLEQFTAYADISDLSEYGNVFIVKQDGTLLSRGYGLDEVDNIKMILGNDKSASKLIKSMQSRKSGFVSLDSGSAKKYICYSRTDFNKWYVVSIVPAQNVEATNEDIKTDGTVFFFEIAMLTVILMLFLVRLVFSESKGNQLNRQRYHFVTKYSDSIIIDYSCAKDTMFCNENWKKVMGFEPEKQELKSDITRYIADEDKERFNQIIEVLRKEKEFVKFQVGVKKEDGEVVKCIFKFAAIKTKRGKIQKVVGVIEPAPTNV